MFIAVAISLACLDACAHAEVNDLRSESKVTPTGITVAKPRFSWASVPDEKHPAQGGYRVCMATTLEELKYPDLWDMGQRVPRSQIVWSIAAPSTDAD